MNYEERNQRKIELMKRINLEYLLVQEENKIALSRIEKKVKEKNKKPEELER